MNAYAISLKVFAPVFIMVGALHLALGAGADVLLGAALSEQTLRDPVLDSQNRFYGISFTLYGVLFYLCAMDLTKYQTVLRCVLWVFFAAGLARIVSLVTHGSPSIFILVLLTIELIMPPVMLMWLAKLKLKT